MQKRPLLEFLVDEFGAGGGTRYNYATAAHLKMKEVWSYVAASVEQGVP